MARIIEHFTVPVPPASAFAYVADFSNTRHWDPQIDTAAQLGPGPIGVGTSFAVELRLGIGSVVVPMVYTVTEHAAPARVVLETSGWWYRGRDDVTIRASADGDGAEVQWDATFALRGPFVVLEPLLAVGFRRTAAKAVAGLRVALGELTEG
jgi:hypothetical protein